MNKATDPVLELLAESGLALPPGAIHYNLTTVMTISRATVTRAITDLDDHEFVRKPADTDTYYRITETGRHYLEGEVDASALESEC